MAIKFRVDTRSDLGLPTVYETRRLVAVLDSQEPHVDCDPCAGALLGKYRVAEQLGEGGMGVVYVGRHETLGHRVVVKVLQPELSSRAGMVQWFFNEAQAATAIRNPGIVQVFDFSRSVRWTLAH
jgi:serine/threonine protein kinase